MILELYSHATFTIPINWILLLDLIIYRSINIFQPFPCRTIKIFHIDLSTLTFASLKRSSKPPLLTLLQPTFHIRGPHPPIYQDHPFFSLAPLVQSHRTHPKIMPPSPLPLEPYDTATFQHPRDSNRTSPRLGTSASAPVLLDSAAEPACSVSSTPSRTD